MSALFPCSNCYKFLLKRSLKRHWLQKHLNDPCPYDEVGNEAHDISSSQFYSASSAQTLTELAPNGGGWEGSTDEEGLSCFENENYGDTMEAGGGFAEDGESSAGRGDIRPDAYSRMEIYPGAGNYSTFIINGKQDSLWDTPTKTRCDRCDTGRSTTKNNGDSLTT
jgi:hypothetical protein